MFTLAVELDHVFGLHWLINQLYKLGFCESYDKVLKFKQTVVTNESIDDLLQNDEGFTTFVADKVDHNITTLDGRGAFHEMAVIAVITKKEQRREVVRRRQKDWIKVDDLVKNKGIPISTYDFSSVCGLKNTIFESYEKLERIYNENVSVSADRFWHTSGLFSTHEDSRPNWSGCMQNISKGSHQPKSKVIMLPILNLNPNNETCICSVLLNVIDQCRKMDIDYPSVTFDQPLWLKELEIIAAKRLRIVPILGGFCCLFIDPLDT